MQHTFHLIREVELSSTNTRLKELARENELPDGTVLLAEFQKSGRGQGTNFWESAPGENLTFTLMLKSGFVSAGKMFLISKAVSIGILSCLEGLSDGFSIKWPNDIYYKDKKIAGILIENQLEGMNLKHSFIGIGLNVNQLIFTSSAPNPVSLQMILNREFDRDILLRNILAEIHITVKKLHHPEGIAEVEKIYGEKIYRRQGFYPFRDSEGEFTARIVKIETDGGMILERENGTQNTYYFKEVEYILG